MNKKYWFTTVKLHKSPGFTQDSFPPVEQLSEGLNAIWGPNGVGKSTLCRALRSLIWKTDTVEGVEAEALLKTPDSSWNLSLSQGMLHQVRQMDNQETNLPGRNDELSESYWFPLHELLQEEGKGSNTFLCEVRKRMQGGVDLPKALEQAEGLSSFSSSRNRLSVEFKEAKKQFDQVKKTQLEQSEIVHQMEDQKNKLEQETVLVSQQKRLLQAKRLLEIKTQLDALTVKLSLHPKEIKQVSITSPQRLGELKEYVNQAKKELEDLQREKENLENEFTSCQIEPERLENLDFPLILQSHFSAYEKSVQKRKDTQERLEKASQAVKTWENEHAWLVPSPPQSSTLKKYLTRLNQLASECEPLRCTLDAQMRLVDAFGSTEALPDDTQMLSSLRFKLLDWMEGNATLSGMPRTRNLNRKVLVWVLCTSLALGIVGLFSSRLFSFFGLFALLFSFPILTSKASLNPEYAYKESELKKKQEGLEELMRTTAEFTLTEWTYAACQQLVGSIDQKLLELQQIKERNDKRHQAKEKCEVARQNLQVWKETWKEAAQALGLLGEGAVLEGSQFFHFSQHLIRWNELLGEKEQDLALFTLAVAQEALTQKILQTDLVTTSSDFPTLQGETQSLFERFKKALEMQKALRKNKDQIGAKQVSEERCKVNLAEFWRKTGLVEGDEEILEQLVSQVDLYENEQNELKIYEKAYEREAEKDENAVVLSQELTGEEIEIRLEHLEKALDEIQKTKESLARMEGEFATLKNGSTLAEAQLKYEEAEEHVERLRKQEVASRMVFELVQELKNESETRYQPEVLKQASAWLGKITSHRYTLGANESGFFAYDTIKAKNHTLEELSSGTRVQLLFSLRMAFIELQERSSGVSLPIFLDELLANSDDERSMAIVQAIHTIAQDRQVFYFTAQREEVEKLRTYSEETMHEVALQDAMSEYRFTAQPFKYYSYQRQEVPLPVEPYQEYGRICSVPGIKLWDSLESLHTWYICTQSEELHTLLQRGLIHLGQVLASDLSFYGNRIRLLKLTQEEAKKGRCRYLTSDDLNDSKLILNRNAAYWKKVEEFVFSGDKTGNDLLDAIDEHLILRFPDANREILANWLLIHDFASEEQPKDKDSILSTLHVHDENFLVNSPEREIVERYLDGVLELYNSSTAITG